MSKTDIHRVICECPICGGNWTFAMTTSTILCECDSCNYLPYGAVLGKASEIIDRGATNYITIYSDAMTAVAAELNELLDRRRHGGAEN